MAFLVELAAAGQAGYKPRLPEPVRLFEDLRVMKNEGHPDYHKVTIVMTDGTRFETRSTLGRAGDVLQLDIDPKTHPAWTGGGQQIVDRGGRVSRFKKKFGDFVK